MVSTAVIRPSAGATSRRSPGGTCRRGSRKNEKTQMVASSGIAAKYQYSSDKCGTTSVIITPSPPNRTISRLA